MRGLRGDRPSIEYPCTFHTHPSAPLQHILPHYHSPPGFTFGRNIALLRNICTFRTLFSHEIFARCVGSCTGFGLGLCPGHLVGAPNGASNRVVIIIGAEHVVSGPPLSCRAIASYYYMFQTLKKFKLPLLRIHLCGLFCGICCIRNHYMHY